MTAGTLLEVIDAAARAAFPDRAERLVHVVERRLWFDPARLPERPVEGEDVEAASAHAIECATCGRARFDSLRAVQGRGGFWQPFDERRAWEVGTSRGSVSLPTVVCGACAIVGGEDPSGDEAALADLSRALERAEREDARTELGRRFAASLAPASAEACACCGRAPARGVAGRAALCGFCWSGAREALTG